MTERTIRTLAKEMAEEWWDNDHSDRFRKFWPSQRVFTQRNWPTFYSMAKTVLTGMLNDKTLPESVKEGISKALIEDFNKNANVKGVTVGKGQLNLNPLHPGAMERKIFHSGD